MMIIHELANPRTASLPEQRTAVSLIAPAQSSGCGHSVDGNFEWREPERFSTLRPRPAKIQWPSIEIPAPRIAVRGAERTSQLTAIRNAGDDQQILHRIPSSL